jgi:hypothetical protein
MWQAVKVKDPAPRFELVSRRVDQSLKLAIAGELDMAATSGSSPSSIVCWTRRRQEYAGPPLAELRIDAAGAENVTPAFDPVPCASPVGG